MILAIPKTLIESISSGAARAYPKECCGLIEGVRTDNGWRVAAFHETKNLAADGAREFLIDPEAHLRLLRALRGTARAIIGCYHSHPNGLAKPSEKDRASASEDGFLWLIAGRGDEIAAFVYRGDRKDYTPIRIERTKS